LKFQLATKTKKIRKKILKINELEEKKNNEKINLSKEKNFNINNSNLSKEKNNLNINVQPVINKNEFSLFDGNSNKDSLFDKVLNQVKEKNKTKEEKRERR